MPTVRLQPAGLTEVTIEGFWGRRRQVNRAATLPIEYRQLRATGRLDAFIWRRGKPNQPHIFWDSDVAKWIEAVAYSLATHPDKALDHRLDRVIARIAAAQSRDGYLNSHFLAVEPEKRWTNLRDNHELYCAGHLIEAAVAHFQATGKRTLLDVLCRYADHIARTFGRRRGQKRGYPGHEEIELALVKLASATGRRRYLDLAKYFVDERGGKPHYFEREARARGEDPVRGRPFEYSQADRPVRGQTTAEGHAVRAMYLYSAMADLARQTRDAGLLPACRRLWRNVVERRMYITGGIGSSQFGERFTSDHDLPNDTAYAETCAAVGLVLFAHRMLQLQADGRYADVLERALYNGVLSGVSQDGTEFFYANPLQVRPRRYERRFGLASDHVTDRRQEWFGCACCPPNLARLLAGLGPYVYSTGAGAAYVHLYAAGAATLAVDGRRVALRQRTEYPWDGRVRFTVGVDAPAAFALMLRIPAWCRAWGLSVNGKTVSPRPAKGYARIGRRWCDGDTVTLRLEMPVERIAAHPSVEADAGKVALQRGPLVYCLEQCDHSADVLSLLLPDRARLKARFRPALLGGCVTIEGPALAPSLAGWAGKLYLPAAQTRPRKVRLTAVPYFLWANRAPGAMTVWIPRTLPAG